MRFNELLLAASTALAASAGPAAAAGQGWIDPVRPDIGWGVVKLRTQVSVTVSGRVARVEVEEHFQNRGGAMGESDYLYPLPGEAVFSNFSLYQGDLELRGETMDADRARAIYEEIVRARRDPALIELAGHGLIRARVFPIQPGETRKISLRYTQLLARAGDALQFRYAAGRPQQAVRERAPLSFTLTADAGFRNAFSPTHEIRNERGSGRLVVQPRHELNGGFTLFLPLSSTPVGLAVATHKPSAEPGYFMLTLSPGAVRAESVPRDITAVIDVSGSMSGEKMRQARAALVQLLGTITRRDRFRLIAFSNEVRAFRAGWSEATEAALAEARRWVEQLQAEGGTNIAGALDEAFAAPTPDDRLGLVIFLTDGLPSVGEQNPERIAQRAERARGGRRVFAFGVGYDVNTYLLDRLSAAARGTTEYVQPGEDVEQAVSALATRVKHPVLTDIRLADANLRITDVQPRAIPDLFEGEELVLFGRYQTDTDVTTDLAVRGRRGTGTHRFATAVRFPAHDNANDFVPRLWAARKIADLTSEIRLNGPNPELVQQIRDLALRHGLLSEYTSYLVQEPMVAAPPAAQTGPGAVQMSRMRAEASAAANEAALKSQQAAFDALAGERRSDQGRTVAGRRFRLQNEVWVDALASAQRTVEIKPFSEAYFRLLRALPELKPYLAAFERVAVGGGKVTVRIDRHGAERLSPAELDRIVKEFKAR